MILGVLLFFVNLNVESIDNFCTRSINYCSTAKGKIHKKNLNRISDKKDG